ncbi:MAG TPA: M1 family metallopeptidase [Gemmatimonadaceae bacterium]|nr:M1 family metallopeptidase [Gemmatimonadaceae bacterium]
MSRALHTSAVVAATLLLGCTHAPSTAPVPLGSTSSLYMPRGVTAAFRKGTRSTDGRPGPRYWQNRARYNISINALPPDRTIRGDEQITYYNNSPDTLRALVIRLLLNIHKPGVARNAGASADYLTSGMQIDTLIVNSRPVPWPGTPRTGTAQRVTLPSPLAAHDSVRLTIRWHFDISKESNREGMIDPTTWFLAYFYPRIAVYDDYNGWDIIPFTDVQEFYSDFNDYDVAITVPRNYVVWGTGTLLNASEVLQPTALERFNRSFTSDQTITVASRAEMAAKSVTKQSDRNTWRFRARNIPDMAFNLSDHYVWDAASVIVDSATRRRASAQAAYNDTATDFHSMVQFVRHSLDWFSRNWPGVPYPYEKSTVVEGFAGMEYPMMVNDESYADTVFSQFVAEHEIAHTYFPFYMGINESRYAMMDEGWATALEYLIGIDDVGRERADSFFREFRVESWSNDPSPNEDLPIITPADALSSYAYGDNAYVKPALGYLALKEMLGDATFRTALHAFMDRWHGKHPIPWDFFNTFNNVTGRNLDWFWNAWYFSPGYIDLAIAGAARSGNGYAVTIDNIGGIPAPADLEATFTDGSTDTFRQTSAMWQANLRRATVVIPTKKSLRSISLNSRIWLDADSTNNNWTQR